jgi:predicted enzyme related to lactoylglutathione lyase
VADPKPSLIEFPADDPERARHFWGGLLGVSLEPRGDGQGEGWQARAGDSPAVGVHARGKGPGDSFSLPYYTVADIGKDSEGSPFGLAQGE